MALGNRRAASYLVLVVLTTLAFTVVYNVGMDVLENRPQPLYQSLEVVFQTFTTTGYGEDAGWDSPWMNYLVIVMQITGIGLILAAVDVFAVPWLRDALAPSAPDSVSDVDGHVVVCEHTPRTDAFVAELDARDREYVLVESDEERATELYESGYRVVHGDPESTETLENAAVETAVAVVADAADDANASIVLAARDVRPDARVITLVEDAELARYHRAAGASEVLSPRQLLGESLAGEIPTAVQTDVGGGVAIGDDLDVVELTVEPDSDICRRTFGEAGLRDRYGVTVIGAWVNGEFETPVPSTEELAAGTRLLVAGEPDQLDRLREATGSTVRAFAPQDVLIAGFGDSGQAAYEALTQDSSRLTVLDVEDGDRVDVLGDARDPAALEAAGITDVSALILTVGDDTTAIFATLIARELNPDLHIVVRANEHEDVQKLYRAGADYAQSLATVSGRMLASTVFEDEEVLAYDRQVSIVRLSAAGLAGSTVAGENVRTETGCTVVAVVRDGETITDFDPATFTLTESDDVVIAGTDEAVTEFERIFSD